MSTKIYNAYKVDDGVNIDVIMNLLRCARGNYHDEIVKFLSLHNERLKCAYDLKDTFGLVDIIKDVMDKGCNDPLNFGASVVVYPYKGNLYLQFFGLDSPLRTDIVDTIFGSICDDYHYQNQSDPWYDYGDFSEEENEVHARDYEERQLVWDGIFGNSWKPSEVGLVFELFTSSDCVSVVFESIRILAEEKKDEPDISE